MAEETSDPKPKKKRNLAGLFKILTIVVVAGSAPVIAWLVLARLDPPKKVSTQESSAGADASHGAEPAAGAESGSHGGGGHGGSGAATGKLPAEILVPLTDSVLEALAAPGNYSDAAVPRVVLKDITTIKRQEITVTLADKGGKKHAVAEIFLTSNDTAALIKRLNEVQPNLYNRVKDYLERKTSKDARDGTFLIRFKAELQIMCQETLGPNMVKDIIVAEFIAE